MTSCCVRSVRMSVALMGYGDGEQLDKSVISTIEVSRLIPKHSDWMFITNNFYIVNYKLLFAREYTPEEN